MLTQAEPFASTDSSKDAALLNPSWWASHRTLPEPREVRCCAQVRCQETEARRQCAQFQFSPLPESDSKQEDCTRPAAGCPSELPAGFRSVPAGRGHRQAGRVRLPLCKVETLSWGPLAGGQLCSSQQGQRPICQLPVPMSREWPRSVSEMTVLGGCLLSGHACACQSKMTQANSAPA